MTDMSSKENSPKLDTTVIGSANSINEGGKGLRFTVRSLTPRPGLEEELIPAFVIKYDTGFHAYLNRCGHIAVQLDFMPGEFFTDDGNTLMCATHGAEYAPDTGACLGGPSFGIGLEPLDTQVIDDEIVLNDSRYVVVQLAAE